MVYDYSHHFRGNNIYTTDVITYINQYLNRDLTRIFEQYLLFSELPKLQLKYNDNSIEYRWNANIENFNMPIRVGLESDYEFIYPTTDWQNIAICSDVIDNWNVNIDRFYIDIEVLE
jgi:hypothetical protein